MWAIAASNQNKKLCLICANDNDVIIYLWNQTTYLLEIKTWLEVSFGNHINEKLTKIVFFSTRLLWCG